MKEYRKIKKNHKAYIRIDRYIKRKKRKGRKRVKRF